MVLAAGDKLGPYEIRAPLGAGGMGEVYRARDTKLQREVAIKVLPEAFATDPDRNLRFTREALLLASLNHPGIAHIYGVEDRAIVMEFVPGPTLAERIGAGAIPLEEALPIAVQIAEAVEYAHDRNVIHRDLKPANVKITPEGTVKVLDFGLAKALADEPDLSDPNNSPTLTMTATRAGFVLGTAAYMSPEQAKGKPVDRRADIWAFGVVLYEMLTGKPLHEGETVAETMASVILKDATLDGLPSVTPPAIRNLLRRCLERDPKQRLQAIGEARIVLHNPVQPELPAAGPPAASKTNNNRWWILAAAAAFVAALALAFVHFREVPKPAPVLRYTIPIPANTAINSLAISPDGRYVAVAANDTGKRQLWIRPLDDLQGHVMATTEEAAYPFWSPDSRYIGFFSQGKLKKIAVSGGPSQSLCDATAGAGGTWSRDNIILFSPAASEGVIRRVPAAGGVPVAVIKGTSRYTFPVFLPDGRHFLYVLAGSSPEKNGIYFGSLDTANSRRILPDSSSVAFARPVSESGPGHILFLRENNLMAQKFDLRTNQAVGDVFPVAEGVFLGQSSNAPISVSENGILTYWTGGVSSAGANQLVWYDRSGKLLSETGVTGNVMMPAISPNEKMIAFSRSPGTADIWIRDLVRKTDIRFTSDAVQNFTPMWSPKGDRIAFRSTQGNRIGDLFVKPANGSGQPELLLSTPNPKVLNQWSRDGRFLVYYEVDPKTKRDIWVLPLENATSDRKPIAVIHSAFEELQGQLSPDSRWIAYTSEESGQREVYVRPFPAVDGLWKISTAGGEQPRWRADGKELFYVAADGKMTAVPVKAIAGPRPEFEAGAPLALFDAHVVNLGLAQFFNYDVTADGKRFLVDSSGTPGVSAAGTPPLTVVINWNAEARQ